MEPADRLFNKVLIEAHYFPCLEYFSVLKNSMKVEIEIHEHFLKQNYNNRCHILSANGTISLTVPLHKSSKLPYKEIKIDNSQKWAVSHNRSIQSAYGKAPFFDHYSERILGVIEKKHTFLLDKNLEIMSICLEYLGIELELSMSQEYLRVPSNDVTDLRSAIHPKKNVKSTTHFTSTPYTQVFGRKFVQNVSVIDLLFCEGPNSGYILRGKKD